MKSSRIPLLAIALALASFVPAAKAQNLINNGTFTGSAAGWTAYGSTDMTEVIRDTYRFGSMNDQLAFLTQSFSTTIGHTYSVSFDLMTLAPTRRSQFIALFGDAGTVFTTPSGGVAAIGTLGLTSLYNNGGPDNGFVGYAVSNWTTFSYSLQASTSSSQILFAGMSFPSFYYLDNVVVTDLGATATPVPEPSTYGLMGAGALGAFALIRRRRAADKAA